MKTFAIPTFMFRVSLSSLAKEIVKQVNTVLFNFITLLSKRYYKATNSDYKDSGLRMPHSETLIKAQTIMIVHEEVC